MTNTKRCSLYAQDELDLSLIPTTTYIRNGVEEVTLYAGISAQREPRVYMQQFVDVFRQYCEYCCNLAKRIINMIYKTEYQYIALPLLNSIPLGVYKPYYPVLRYSFYAKQQIERLLHTRKKRRK